MGKLSGDLYKATRALGKLASTVNDAESLGKSISTGDPSYFLKRMARKATGKAVRRGANSISDEINKLLK